MRENVEEATCELLICWILAKKWIWRNGHRIPRFFYSRVHAVMASRWSMKKTTGYYVIIHGRLVCAQSLFIDIFFIDICISLWMYIQILPRCASGSELIGTRGTLSTRLCHFKLPLWHEGWSEGGGRVNRAKESRRGRERKNDEKRKAGSPSREIILSYSIFLWNAWYDKSLWADSRKD